METIPRTSGIYKWTCTPTKKIYIGSAGDIRKRYREHVTTLRKKTHVNVHFQRAWDKYGESAFTFQVVELVLSSFRLEREQYWLDKLRPFDRKKGFNISPTAGTSLGSKYPAGRGRKWTPEQRMAMSEYRKNQPISPEQRAKMIAGLRGTLPSQASKDARYRKNAKHWLVTDPNGNEYQVFGLSAFCREHGLNRTSLQYVASGKFRQYKGWICRYQIGNPEGILP